jgi:hypothetical protein
MLLILGAPVHASEWVSLGMADSGKIEFLIDTSSIRVSTDIRRAWIKKQFAPHTQEGYVGVTPKWETYTLSREAFDCAVGTGRTEGLTLFFEDGTYHALSDSLYPDPWRPIRPETALNTWLNFICAWKPAL